MFDVTGHSSHETEEGQCKHFVTMIYHKNHKYSYMFQLNLSHFQAFTVIEGDKHAHYMHYLITKN
jgi:hypothetical protein